MGLDSGCPCLKFSTLGDGRLFFDSGRCVLWITYPYPYDETSVLTMPRGFLS